MNEITGLRTKGEILDHCALQVQDVSTAQRTILGSHFETAYRSALRRMLWPQLIRERSNFITLTSSDIHFHTPKEMRLVIKLVDASQPFVFRNVSAQAMFEHTRGFPNLQGSPGEFADMGQVAINTVLDETDGEAVEILSSGTDTRTGYAVGFDASNERVRETFTLNGTSAVTLSTSFIDITELALDTRVASRTVTLRKQSDATVISTINENELAATYNRFRLSARPGVTSSTYHLVYIYEPPSLLADTDRLIIPVEDYIIHYVISQHYMQRRQSNLARQEFALAEDMLKHAMSEAESRVVYQATPFNRQRRPLGVIVEGPTT